MEYFQPLKRAVSILKKDSFSNNSKLEGGSGHQGDMVGRDSVSIPRGPLGFSKGNFQLLNTDSPSKDEVQCLQGANSFPQQRVAFYVTQGGLLQFI